MWQYAIEYSTSLYYFLPHIAIKAVILYNRRRFSKGSVYLSILSNNLKKAIELSGTTIYSLAKEINYDRGTLNKQLNGQRKLTKDVFFKIINFINITTPRKLELIDLFHQELFESYYYTFNLIKDSFSTYSKTIINGYNSNASELSVCNINLDNYQFIQSESAIISIIKSIILSELERKNPKIYFNFNVTNQDLIAFFLNIYIKNSSKLDIKNILQFSCSENNSANNLNKFIKILPLLLHGYCPYYYYSDGNIKSETSMIFPYYFISSNEVILISIDFDKALVFTDKSIVQIYQKQFFAGIAKCKQFKYHSSSLLEMPYLFSDCIDSNPKVTIGSLNEKFCALPFMSDKHLTQMLSNTINNHEIFIKDLMNCYKTVNDFIALVPVESIKEFIETGTDCHTTNDLAEPLSMKQRIEILETTKMCISNGQKYLFYKKNEFFCLNLTFHMMSDSKILFFNSDNNTDKNSISVITTPSGLLTELDCFFNALCKSCYVVSKEESLKYIEEGIEYAKSLLA